MIDEGFLRFVTPVCYVYGYTPDEIAERYTIGEAAVLVSAALEFLSITHRMITKTKSDKPDKSAFLKRFPQQYHRGEQCLTRR